MSLRSLDSPTQHTRSTAGFSAVWLLLIGAALAMIGCSSTPGKPTGSFSVPGTGTSTKASPQHAALYDALSQHFRSWANAPYKLGGLSRSGIDCSGFVHVTYRDVFDTSLPRSTERLAQTGKAVAKQSLQFGDLVFFKTGRTKRHVGIYVDNGKFIHASSSRGVMQSSLHSDYWSAHYWRAQRIL